MRKKERKKEKLREREHVLSRGTPLSVIHRRCSIYRYVLGREKVEQRAKRKNSLSLSLSTRTIQFVVAKETNSVERRNERTGKKTRKGEERV